MAIVWIWEPCRCCSAADPARSSVVRVDLGATMTSPFSVPPIAWRSGLRFAWLCACVLIGLVAFAGAFAAKGDRLPYKVGFLVDYGEQAGPESWREEFEFLVIEHLQSRRCFEVVRRFDPDDPVSTDLLIHVIVAHVEERQNYDISETELYDPDRPPDTEKLFTLELEADFELELRKLPEDVIVRRKRLHARTSYRPRFDEDARYAIRLKVIEDIERALVTLSCKGPEKKLVRDIEKALSEAAD